LISFGVGQDDDAAKKSEDERASEPKTKGYSGWLVWACSEQRGSTSPLHDFVLLLPGGMLATGELTLREGSRFA